MRKLKENPDFTPCTPEIGDKMLGGYPYKWNVTRAADWIEKNAEEVELSAVQADPPSPGRDSADLDEAFIPKAELSRPIIMVRMRPEFFRLMDGNHRVAKARRLGVKELPAYYLTEAQHRQFFVFEEADRLYVKYWNQKLKMLEKEGRACGIVGEVRV